MGIGEILPLAAGVCIAFAMQYLVPKSKRFRIPINAQSNILIWLSLFIFLWSVSFSTSVAIITSGGDVMNYWQSLVDSLQILTIMAFIAGGCLLGWIIIGIIEGIRSRKENPKKEDFNITLNKVKEYRKLKKELDEFFDDLPRE